ncbi:MAG TPA: MFS transporter [Caulobacteraceae bacterium]|nr:MFS transporter [Caulobacteraceae bacterium]
MAHAPAATADGYPGHGSSSYRAYALGALLVVYTFNFIDRVVVGIIQEPIKTEFGLTDFQLGLLGGPAFAVLYTFLGIPIARLAERRNRMTILSVCVALWSAATALCGLATSYTFLLLARIGVSVGEAGCTPPAQSVISDYFPAKSRATAMSIYALGIPIGSLLAAVGGGWLAHTFGWRSAFLILGLPGLVLAVIVKLTVKEPPRSSATFAAGAGADETPTLREAFRELMKKPTFWHTALGAALASFVGYGVGQYLNSFLMRTHELTLLESSRLTGVVLGVASAVGTFAAGWIADRIAKKYPNAIAWLPAVGFFIATPAYLAGYTAPTLTLAVPFLVIGALTHYFYLGSMYAITSGIVKPRMRATAVAVLLFIVNLLGYGLGPPVIGALSDFLRNTQLTPLGLSGDACEGAALALNAAVCGPASEFGLRWAIFIGLFGYLWAAAHFLFAWRTLRRDWVG